VRVGLANALPFSCKPAAEPAPRFYTHVPAAGLSATACWTARGAGRESLEPDLDLVSIGIGDVGVREAGRKLPSSQQRASGPEALGHGCIDVFGMNETKPKVRDSSTLACGSGIEFERDYVIRTRTFHLDAVFIPVVLLDAECPDVESHGPIEVGNEEADVRETMRAYHEEAILVP